MSGLLPLSLSFPGCVRLEGGFGEWVLPAQPGLPCLKILIVGVSAIIHFFPDGMLASDKEPPGKTVRVICKPIASPAGAGQDGLPILL